MAANLGERLKEEREAQDITQAALAAMVTKLGFKLTQSAIEKIEGRGATRPRCLRELAAALKVRQQWLLDGKPPKTAPARQPALPRHGTVRLLGFAGARAQVNVVDTLSGDRDQDDGIDPPILDGDDWYVVLVRGRSMHPVYRDGDKLFFRKIEHGSDDIHNRDCVVETERGRVYVKTIRKARDGLFDLLSYDQSIEPIRDVALRWAAPIRVVERG